MPKVRLLAPWTNAKGEPQAAGAVVEVTDEQAIDLHNRGQASLVEEEEEQAKAAQEGNYSARLERPEAKAPPESPPEPTAPPEEPPPAARKK